MRSSRGEAPSRSERAASPAREPIERTEADFDVAFPAHDLYTSRAWTAPPGSDSIDAQVQSADGARTIPNDQNQPLLRRVTQFPRNPAKSFGSSHRQSFPVEDESQGLRVARPESAVGSLSGDLNRITFVEAHATSSVAYYGPFVTPWLPAAPMRPAGPPVSIRHYKSASG